MVSSLFLHLLAFVSALEPAVAQKYSNSSISSNSTGDVQYATGQGPWAQAYQKASAFVSKLNLTEKAGMVTGTLGAPCVGGIAPIPRVGFKGLCLQDGPLAI